MRERWKCMQVCGCSSACVFASVRACVCRRVFVRIVWSCVSAYASSCMHACIRSFIIAPIVNLCRPRWWYRNKIILVNILNIVDHDLFRFPMIHCLVRLIISTPVNLINNCFRITPSHVILSIFIVFLQLDMCGWNLYDRCASTVLQKPTKEWQTSPV